MKLRDYIVIGAMIAAAALLLHFLRDDPSVPSDPGKEKRDSTENLSNVDLSNSVEWKRWSDSVLTRAAAIANGRDRERISTNTEAYIREHGLDTASQVLMRSH